MNTLVEGMNPAQAKATLAPPAPLLVLAGAGSGKTRVLTHRVAHMVDLGFPPESILAITFTNKAAQEMRARLLALLGNSARDMWISTFHSMCVRILRAHAERLGFTPQFTIYDTDDARRLMKCELKALNLYGDGIDEKKVLADVSAYKNGESAASFAYAPEQFTRTSSTLPRMELARAARAYDQALFRANAMDFDNLLLNAYQLLCNNPDVLDEYRARFKFVAVDEYQDTNHLQFLLTNLLAPKADSNITVVGDDDQAIYSWRGGDISNILNFEQHYPAALVVKLEQNYRSSGHILAAANAVVRRNATHREKTLFTELGDGELIQGYQAADDREEGRWIALECARLSKRGESYNDMAVFYRVNAQSRVLEDMFLRAGVPYKVVGGARFFQRAEIRDVMAYLKLVNNPRDNVSALRVVNTPRRGIGATSQAKISAYANAHNLGFFEAACVLSADAQAPEQGTTPAPEQGIAPAPDATASTPDAPKLPPATKKALAAWCASVKVASTYSGALAEVVETILQDTDYLPALEEDTSLESISRAENVREFIRMTAEFDHDNPDIEPGQKLAHFLEWLALRTDIDTLDDEASAVTLMTVHTAKGLEFNNVFVTGLEEGLFPLVRDNATDEMEEERRLAYVAFTRAKKRLYLTNAQSRMMHGSVSATSTSRFLREIPSEHIKQQGIGSKGFYGLGHEKRGSRRGMYGAGTVGGGAYGMRATSAPTQDEDFSGTIGTGEGAGADNFAPVYDLAIGDRVKHRVFGTGTVTSAKEDQVEVQFDSGLCKRLLVEFAPFVRISD